MDSDLQTLWHLVVFLARFEMWAGLGAITLWLALRARAVFRRR